MKIVIAASRSDGCPVVMFQRLPKFATVNPSCGGPSFRGFCAEEFFTDTKLKPG